jgi:SSS family solute:Na+ symporter
MGIGREPLRHLYDLVPDGGRLLYGLGHGRASRAGLWRGAMGAFGVAYSIFIFPVLFVFGPRLWSVCRKHGYVTAADFVRGRYGNRWLASAVALTGLVATMPYIALQLVGVQVVIAAMGLETQGLAGDLPLIIAFVILAGFTYTSGLRAPAAIAVVKDVLLYITGITAIVGIPMALGGFPEIFRHVPMEKLTLPIPEGNSLGSYSIYVTLGIGSALSWGLYPHSITGLLSANHRRAIQRNAFLLPLYTIVIALMLLMGYMAIAAGVAQKPEFASLYKQFGSTFAVPALYLNFFPSWFVGLAFAGIGIGALVPASIMSIAAANLFSRNVYREFWRSDCSPQQETAIAKLVSLLVKFGALVIIFALPKQYMVNLQLMGSIAIIQTLPAVFLSLYTRWFNPWALLLGWACGLTTGMSMLMSLSFASPYFSLAIGDYSVPGYVGIYAFAVNLIVVATLTSVIRFVQKAGFEDETAASDYLV